MSFEDNILLSLKRRYSKDEELKFIFKQLSDSGVEIGMLKSENAELKDKVVKLEGKIWGDREDKRRKEEARKTPLESMDGMCPEQVWQKYISMKKKYEKLQDNSHLSSLDTGEKVYNESENQSVRISSDMVLGGG